jgi:hypothetical protein
MSSRRIKRNPTDNVNNSLLGRNLKRISPDISTIDRDKERDKGDNYEELLEKFYEGQVIIFNFRML